MMDEDPCSTNSLPPFIAKIYEMVDDSSTDFVVSWSKNNRSFVVWKPPEFARDLLPKYFKHSNFSSFIRQLNTYGFRKVDPENWEFANDDFIRSKPHLLKNIYRRKPVYSHSGTNLYGDSSPLSESERQRYKDDIEKLKSDKELCRSELEINIQNQRGLKLQLQRVTELIHNAEKCQKIMLSSLARALDKPELELGLVPQLGLTCRKRRLPGNNSLHNNQVNSSQDMTRENMSSISLLLDQLESSLIFWENIFQDLAQTGIPQYSLSPELNEPRSFADLRAKARGIDMNSEPNNVPTRVNDVFWEQFLTEIPGSSNVSQEQQENKDLDTKNGGRNSVNHKRLWKNMKNVNINSLDEHNAPAEIT